MMTQKIRQLGSLPSGPFVLSSFTRLPVSVKRVATKSQTSAIYALIRDFKGPGRGELAM